MHYNSRKMSGSGDEGENRQLRAEIRRLRETLRKLTPSLEVILRRRGFSIYKREPKDDLLVPAGDLLDGYYVMLKHYSFRLFLRDVIKHQRGFTLPQVTRYATREVTTEYLRYLEKIGLVKPGDSGYTLAGGTIKSFGETLEWFIAEIFRRELSAEAIWGIKMKRPRVGGDYDLLAKIDGSVLCMEVKSSPPKQIYQTEIRTFLDRICDLRPEIAVFFVDTELRMKDKIVPMFEEEMSRRFVPPPEVRRMERELFEVSEQVCESLRVFIINAKDSIIQNIERVLIEYFRRTL